MNYNQIRNILIYLVPIGIGSLMPIITIPIFTRILTPEDYGLLALSMIYAIFMSGLASFGIPLVFERNYFKYIENPKKMSQLLYSSLSFIFFNFIILLFLSFILRDKISYLFTSTTENSNLFLASFAGHFFFNSASSIYFTYYKNSEKAKLYSKYKIWGTILNLIFSIILIVMLKTGVIGIVLSQLISGIIIFLIFSFSFLKNSRFLIDTKILLESIKISFPLTPRIFFGVLITQFDKYMISILATIGGVGIYHIGKNVSSMIFNLTTALENVFNPKVYQLMFSKDEKDRLSIGEYLTPFIYITILISLLCAIFSEEIIKLLTPISYHGAIPIVTILSMYFGLMFFGKIVGIQLLYKKKTFITSILTFLSIATNIIINIPLILKFGALGAAWATLIAGTISGIISFIIAQRYYFIKYEWIKLSFIVCTFFIVSISVVSLHLLNFQYQYSLLVKLISLVVYIGIGINFGIISKDNLREFLRAVYPKKIKTT